MIVTPEYAIKIHTKALATRCRGETADEAEIHAKKLKKSGDLEVYEVWTLVSWRINKIRKFAKSAKKRKKEGRGLWFSKVGLADG